MPTFSAIALERLIEPGASKSADKTPSPPASNYPPLPKPKPLAKTGSLPGPRASSLERRNSASSLERKPSRPQLSPALYATPEATPLPDSPSSYTPSPYVVNHKRRGPRLLKSASEADMASRGKGASGEDALDQAKVIFGLPKGNLASFEVVSENGFRETSAGGEVGGSDRVVGSSSWFDDVAVKKDDDSKLAAVETDRDVDEDDFFDPLESMSFTSNTESAAGSVSNLFGSARASDFYDAWEELSSESGQQFSSSRDIETDLREMRLNLLMEIEKRKQAEEDLSSILSHWQKIRQQLSLVGITLPASPVDAAESGQDVEPTEELCQQVYLARFVANSIGRGTAKAEMEIVMQARLEAKNVEIARLLDRLHYYEAMNQEMSQRNQEAVEVARRNRLTRRRRRQRWVWGSIAAAITLGTAALTWSYLGPARGSSSSDAVSAVDHDNASPDQ